MSDVAVTWAKAQTCMGVLKGRNGQPDRMRVDRNAKQVLVHMASYADATGEAWALVSLLALEMDVEERTVERGRKALCEAGLLIKTGRTKTYKGKVIPIFQLPLETGHASTVRRMLAERDACAPVDNSAWGDAGVAPSGDLGATPVTPQTDAGVTPRGDTGDTQIGKLNSKGLTPCASVRANEIDRAGDDRSLTEAMAAWSRKAPARVGPDLVRVAWAAALARSGWRAERLAAATTACVANDPDFGRGKAMNLNRWLDEARYLPWDRSADVDADALAGSARAMWSGPNRVREVVLAEMGESGAASYLDPATWDGERSAIVVRTGLAVERLMERVGPALSAMGVKVERARG